MGKMLFTFMTLTPFSEMGSSIASKHSRQSLTLSRPDPSCAAMQLVTRAGCRGGGVGLVRAETQVINNIMLAMDLIITLKIDNPLVHKIY